MLRDGSEVMTKGVAYFEGGGALILGVKIQGVVLNLRLKLRGGGLLNL